MFLVSWHFVEGANVSRHHSFAYLRGLRDTVHGGNGPRGATEDKMLAKPHADVADRRLSLLVFLEADARFPAKHERD